MTIFEISKSFPNVEKKLNLSIFSPITSFFPLIPYFPLSPFVLLKNETALASKRGNFTEIN